MSYSLILDILLLLLIIILLIIIFNRYIYSKNFAFLNKLTEKYIPLREWFNKRISTGIDYNSKFVLILFIFNTISLFFIISLKLIITSELLVNLDSYVEVFNYIHRK